MFRAKFNELTLFWNTNYVMLTSGMIEFVGSMYVEHETPAVGTTG